MVRFMSPPDARCRMNSHGPTVSAVQRLLSRDRRIAEGATREDRLAAAELRDASRLVRARATIDRFRIDDPPQLRETVANQTGVAGIGREIVALLRVAIEVEQHRRHADVVDELERAVANHERPGRAAGCVVLAQHGSARRGAARKLEERMAGQTTIVGMPRHAGGLEYRREAIDQTYRLAAYHARRDVRTGHDQRDSGGLLVHRRFSPQAPVAEVVAVIARVD